MSRDRAGCAPRTGRRGRRPPRSPRPRAGTAGGRPVWKRRRPSWPMRCPTCNESAVGSKPTVHADRSGLQAGRERRRDRCCRGSGHGLGDRRAGPCERNRTAAASPTHPLRCGGVPGRPPRRRRLPAAVRRLRPDERRPAVRRPRRRDRRGPAARRPAPRRATAATPPGVAVRLGALAAARRADGTARPLLPQPPGSARGTGAGRISAIDAFRDVLRRAVRRARRAVVDAPHADQRDRAQRPASSRRSATARRRVRPARPRRRRRQRRAQPADPPLRLRLRPRRSGHVRFDRDDHLLDRAATFRFRPRPADRRRRSASTPTRSTSATRCRPRWLEACVWPDQVERFERLGAAIEIANRVGVDVRRGDAVESVADARRRGRPRRATRS